ncbi:MAG: sensor histidine kinase [Coriobacteriales bacterium]
MLKGLRRRIMAASIAVLVLVYVCLSLGIYGATTYRTNSMLDTLADAICLNGGELPSEQEIRPMLDGEVSPSAGVTSPLSVETPYSTRFFHVFYGLDGQVAEVDIRYVASVDREEALAYAQQARAAKHARGWIDSYRYKVCYEHEDAVNILFIDGRLFQERDRDLLVMLMGASAVFLLISLLIMYQLMRYVTKPVEDSYERQKRFISNASHELKTPLTLILADADMEEWERGPSEWIDGIRQEARDISELVSQMVVLSHLDEGARVLNLEDTDITKIVEDSVVSWKGQGQVRGLTIDGIIKQGVVCKTDAASVKQVLFILMDNANKYCDEGGTVRVGLEPRGRKGAEIRVENSYSKAAKVEPERLFERFYRMDSERSEKVGHGIGLALAKETAENLGGSLEVYTTLTPPTIGFRFTL